MRTEIIKKASLLTFFFVLLFRMLCIGQFAINPGVDTSDDEAKRALNFYSKYLSEFNGVSVPDFCKYWPSSDCKRLKCPDPLLYAIVGNFPTYNLGTATVIYIKPDKEIVNIKTHIGSVDTIGNIYTICITNHYIDVSDTTNLRFISPFAISVDNWEKKTIGDISYHFPKELSFNVAKSDSLILQIRELEKDWGLSPIKFDYYFANTREEIQKLRGFDFSIEMGNRQRPSGMADENYGIFCSGLGENYFHEVVHLYISPIYPKSVLKEGIAVFYGGSMGQNLDWHKERLRNYLRSNPKIDLTDSKSFYFDSFTNPGYTIQGLICKDTYGKDKLDGLKRIMAYTSLDELMLKEYHATRDKWNDIFKQLIEE